MIDASRSLLFREVNERIAELADSWKIDAARSFLCECDRLECAEAVDLSRAEYEAVRAHPTHFFAVSMHVGGDSLMVIDRLDGYVVLEWSGPAAVEAEARDPRSLAPAETKDGAA